MASRFQLAVFWLLYMAGMGVFFPFCSLYLKQRLGFSPSEVGVLMAAVPLASLIFQPAWGLVADRTGSRQRILVLLSLGAAVSAAVLHGLRGFFVVLMGMGLFAAFHSAVLPMATAVTLGRVGSEGFGTVRMWGTVGFLLAVVGFPLVMRRISPDPSDAAQLEWLFPVVGGLALAAALGALVLPGSGQPEARSREGQASRLLRQVPMLRLLAVVVVIHFFIQGPIHLFPLFVSSRGGDASTVSRMWIFMLALEIPLLAFSGRSLRRFGARALLNFGLVTEGVRWLICAASHDLRWVMAVQLLHGVAVAGILVGAALYVERSVPPELRSTGQALVSMAGAGGGAILSNTVGGWMMETFSVETPYWMGGAGALLLALSLRALLPKPQQLEC
ncbi:MAG: MFS transporter [Acidobacteria bacterium]|nr:MFS transporter [Acidobacteriota bacterium]